MRPVNGNVGQGNEVTSVTARLKSLTAALETASDLASSLRDHLEHSRCYTASDTLDKMARDLERLQDRVENVGEEMQDDIDAMGDAPFCPRMVSVYGCGR